MIQGSDRELAILTIERLLNHLKRQAAAAPGSSPFTPAEAYALMRGLRTIKAALFPHDEPIIPPKPPDPADPAQDHDT